MVAPIRALVLPALLTAAVCAIKPPISYRYADTLREALSSEQRRIVPLGGEVWNVKQDNAAAFLHGLTSDELIGQTDGVTLTAIPPLLNDGEDLVVSWSGVKQPHQTDFVGLSCGSKAHDQDFLVKIGVTEAVNRLTADDLEGPQSIRFSSLYMMRCNYTVEYFNFQPRGNAFAPLAKVEVGMKEKFSTPKHGHIAFTSHVDEMSVMFNSASNEMPVVKPANLTSQQWFRDPGNMHTVILKKLKLGTRYFYKFGSEKDGWSAVYSFMSRPDDSVKNAKFIAYADMGVDSAPAATSTAVRSYQDVMDGYDSFLLHFGDISYARGHAHMWDEFFHLIEPYATRVPYMVSIGNHEYDYMTGGSKDPSGAAGADGRMDFHPDWANYGEDSSGECSVPMFYRWDAPDNGNSIYWYSYDYGGVHVIQISSEHDWRRGSKQYKWLEEDLKHVDREKTPWIVLTSHRMMYTTQMGEEADYKVSVHFREEVEDLLWEHKVNLMLVGHQHSYERSCAVRNGKCIKDGNGPVHIVVGSAGAGLEEQGFSDKLGEWSVSHMNDWGYLRIESTEQSMSVQFILNRNGVVYDEVTLTPWL
ncbi:hypothetical protein JM18_000186 [Phytophthora kernoviae]|uniref:Purple acid phosphatase n=2 Tax=Phytophthora kernoviae TaxID=325452 RepID=A0A8T0MDX3_9STRA|nr:hypothetical protein G195_002087 [Phytophthora kernoviae 00238/432]KAG2533063.1 hypothetical protein JM16_000167 [Phytophthora kernoviae]KAG2533310.1 hypothetical protein JM18_000186 [Phytophthora kernoviae]